MKLNSKHSLVAVAVLAGFAAQSAVAGSDADLTTWPPVAAGAAAAVAVGEYCGYGQNTAGNTKAGTKSGQMSAAPARKRSGASELGADAVPQTSWTETVELVPVTALAEAQAAMQPAQAEQTPVPVKKAVVAKPAQPKAKLAGKTRANPAQAGAYAYGGTGNCVADMMTVSGKVYAGMFQIPATTTSAKAAAVPASQSMPAYQTVVWQGTR